MINLLEGLRDLKAPLASGLIILFGVWLIFANEIASAEPGESIAGNLLQLAAYLGGPATLGLIAFLGYFIGLVLNLHRVYRALKRRVSNALYKLFCIIFKTSRSMSLRGEYSFATRLRLHDYIINVVNDALENRGWTLEEMSKIVQMDSTTSILASRENDDLANYTRLRVYDNQPAFIVSKLHDQITADMDLLAIQLQSEKEKIYEQYDKNKTESDFRAAIILPTFFVAIVLLQRFADESQTVSFAIIGALLLVMIRLDASANERLYQANEALLSSLVVGHIKSPRLLVFERTRLPKPDGNTET